MNHAPWHSVKLNAPLVYHDDTRCTEGNNIETQYLRQGTGGRRLCNRCATIR